MTPGRRLVFAFVALLGIVSLGTAGYSILEGWELGDALYMTVITISTVGYREVFPLDAQGKAFTIALIIFGVGGMLYTLSGIVQYVVEGEFQGAIWRRRMKGKIEKLRGHVIICGYGRVGATVCSSLKRDGVESVIVDTNPDSIARCTEDGFLYVEGDATKDEILRAAGIDRARGLVSAVDSDASNIYVTLSARGLRPDLLIVARANTNGSENKLRRAGADRVISPYSLGGRRMASLVTRPLVIDFLDTAMHSESMEWLMEQVKVSHASSLVGMTIEQARAKHAAGAAILAIAKPDGTLVTNPTTATIFEDGDILVAIGTPAQLRVLEGLS